MKAFHSKTLRAFLAGVLLITLGTTLGFAQPKAEKQEDADSVQTPATVASPGILVMNVQEGSPAEKAGITRGDIILEVQGTAVNTLADLERVMDGRKAGDTLSVKLKHGDAVKTVSLTLGTRQGQPWAGIVPAPSAFAFGPGLRGFGMLPGMHGGHGAFGGMPFTMRMGAAGVEVTSVTSGSPAEKAGLAQGDVILSLDGTRIDPRNTLSDMVAARKAGDTVALSVRSAGQDALRDVKVTLAKNPDKDGAWLGIGYTWARPERISGPHGGSMMAGVLVAEVTDNGPAAKAGIKARDIITAVEGVAVADPQLVADAIAKHKAGDSVLVTVYRMADDKETDITVTLGQSPSDPAKAWLGVAMSNFVGFEGMPFPGRGAPAEPGTGGRPRALSEEQESPTI